MNVVPRQSGDSLYLDIETSTVLERVFMERLLGSEVFALLKVTSYSRKMDYPNRCCFTIGRDNSEDLVKTLRKENVQLRELLSQAAPFCIGAAENNNIELFEIIRAVTGETKP